MLDTIAEKKTEKELRLDSWREWRRLCALGLCAEQHQSSLREFARLQFGRYVYRYAYKTNTDAKTLLPKGSDAWHLFETHLTVKTTRQGKHYKDWLFARVPTDTDQGRALDAGAALLMRDVVREYLHQETLPAETISTQSIVPDMEGCIQTIEDLLPGTIVPSDDVAVRELDRLARTHADSFASTLTHRETVAVLAKELGLSLAHEIVVRVAGCRKSMLNHVYREVLKRLALSLKELYKREEPDAVRHLVLMSFSHLGASVSHASGNKEGFRVLFKLDAST